MLLGKLQQVTPQINSLSMPYKYRQRAERYFQLKELNERRKVIGHSQAEESVLELAKLTRAIDQSKEMIRNSRQRKRNSMDREVQEKNQRLYQNIIDISTTPQFNYIRSHRTNLSPRKKRLAAGVEYKNDALPNNERHFSSILDRDMSIPRMNSKLVRGGHSITL
jgi:hypothetical protein